MNIVLDENIPLAEHYFRPFVDGKKAGALRFFPGREISAEHLKDADALIVRSVTPVNQRLLEHSPVKFVGSCTIGMDHLAIDYLDDHRIAYSNAPACNANSVVEYVFAALLKLACDWRNKRLGIIGMGNVGSALYRRAQALGIEVVAFDPLIEQDRYPVLDCLDAVLACDIVSMHTPLTHQGPAPTYQMIGAAEIAKLKPNAVLLNCGRGDCLDNQALLNRLESTADLKTVLDVWQQEPNILPQVLAAVDIASPHIAGYSYDGKVAGTAMIAKALANFLGAEQSSSTMEKRPVTALQVSGATTAFEVLQKLVPQCYDIAADDRNLRQAMASYPDDFAKAFDRLRKHYPKRREFNHFALSEFGGLAEKEKQRLEHSLAALGFSQ